MKVFKFGGACIQNPESVGKLGQITKTEQPHPLVVVVSAMGKTTRALEGIFQQKGASQAYALALQQLYRFHQAMIDQLLVALRQEADQALVLWQKQLVDTLAMPVTEASSDRLYSRIVAGGELLASKLIYYYLQEQHVACVWLDARDYIKTNSRFCSAQVDWVATQCLVQKDFLPLLAQKQVVVTQGFIGSNEAGETTTLGKEGSDFTGAILAAALGAQSLTIWKDVPGIMSADPKLFKEATKFDRLSYQTMEAMAFYGAKVVHPKTIQPLAAHNIPLYVKPFHQPYEAGTAIAHGPAQLEHPTYILREDQGLVQLGLDGLPFFNEERLQKEIFYPLAQQPLSINLLARNACTLSICLDEDPCKVQTLLAMLKQSFKVQYYAQVSLLTVMHQDARLAQPLLRQKTILLAQQKPGLYQVVFQHKETV